MAAFDVICAGEPFWTSFAVRGGRLVPAPARAALLDVARQLARRGLRVGLAAVLDDDRRGRAVRAQMRANGVDVRGITMAPPTGALMVVDAAGGQVGVVAEAHAGRDFEVPAEWSSQVLLLSGLSPVTSKAAALCKAARRARRDGTVVVLDLAGSLRQWTGRDPRVVSMVIREADVVRCSFLQLAVLGTEAASIRRSMRRDATLVVHDDLAATATGPFGEVRVEGRRRGPGSDADEDTSCAVDLCVELARPRRDDESV